jgi:hypothetical protein
MKMTPRYRPNQKAPAEDVYVAVDGSGCVLSASVWRRQGDPLPLGLTVGGTIATGYIRFGDLTA